MTPQGTVGGSSFVWQPSDVGVNPTPTLVRIPVAGRLSGIWVGRVSLGREVREGQEHGVRTHARRAAESLASARQHGGRFNLGWISISGSTAPLISPTILPAIVECRLRRSCASSRFRSRSTIPGQKGKEGEWRIWGQTRKPRSRRARVRVNHGMPSSRRASSADRLAPFRYSARARSISAWNFGLRLSPRDSRSSSSMGTSAAMAWPPSVKTSDSCSSSRAYSPSDFVARVTSIVFLAHAPRRRSRPGSSS
jgi:hypothetical protein